MKPVIQVLLLACCLAVSGVGADELTIIDLRYRTAEEVLPVLRPVLDPDVVLSGTDYKLLVRGDAGDVARIRELLAVLDRAPRQLLVSVRYTDGAQDRTAGIGADADIDRHSTSVVVHGSATTQTTADRNVSSVRVLEGNIAHISAGPSVPVVTAFVTHHRGRPTGIGVDTEYRDLSTGFDVLPRVNGERVVLEISSRQQRLLDPHTGSAAVQRVDSVIAGRLGEWIDLGAIATSAEERRSGVATVGGGHRVTSRSDSRGVSVMVEQVE